MPRVTRFRVVTAAVTLSAVAFGTAACGGSSSSAATSASSSASPSATASKTKAKRKGVMGKVTSVSATSLTIVRKNGTSQTYSLDSTTKYGSKMQPLQASDIKIGEMVVVVPGAGGTSAMRITLAKRQTATPAPTPS